VDPERVCCWAIPGNPANPIRARNWQVHRQGKRHRDDLTPKRNRPSANDLHLRRRGSLPSLRRQSNECSRRQGYQALVREGDSHLNITAEIGPGSDFNRSDRTNQSVAPVTKKAVGATPKAGRAAKTTKTPQRPPRSLRAASSTESLVCRYCGSDDLAPSFRKRRDARCRAASRSAMARSQRTRRARELRRRKSQVVWSKVGTGA
jgi:hypothetical protein